MIFKKWYKKSIKESFEYDMDIHFQGPRLGFKNGELNNLYYNIYNIHLNIIEKLRKIQASEV